MDQNIVNDHSDNKNDENDFSDLDRRLQEMSPQNDQQETTPEVPPEIPPGFDRVADLQEVPLDQIEQTEIQSPNDFDSQEQYQSMKREVEMLKQMKPAISQNANGDTFDDWDKANQIGHYSPESHTRGYQDVYHSYYGNNDCIALSPNKDGGYDIINGRHRIYLAREAGLKSIPARMV
jgi:hypothetical protein